MDDLPSIMLFSPWQPAFFDKSIPYPLDFGMIVKALGSADKLRLVRPLPPSRIPELP